MGFYRKKPVTVEAIQWNDNNLEIQAFCKDAEFEARLDVMGVWLDLYINTLEGRMKASKGDYIVKGVNGEFYPCKPDIFEKTYEKVQLRR